MERFQVHRKGILQQFIRIYQDTVVLRFNGASFIYPFCYL